MLGLLFMLLLQTAGLYVDAGPDQTIKFPTVSRSQPQKIQLRGEIQNGVIGEWRLLDDGGALDNPKSLTPKLTVWKPGVYRCWLVAGNSKEVKFDIVRITVMLWRG